MVFCLSPALVLLHDGGLAAEHAEQQHHQHQQLQLHVGRPASSQRLQLQLTPARRTTTRAALAFAHAAAAPPAAAATGPPPQQQKHQHPAASGQPPWLGASLDVAGYTQRGWMEGGGKEQNQDRGLILERFRGPTELLVGVLDGHGSFGHQVSAFLACHLPGLLLQQLTAAAGVHSNGGGGGGAGAAPVSPKQRRGLWGGSKQQPAHHQQQEQYVLVPDHSPWYGRSDGAAAPSDSSSSSEEHSSHGRPVAKVQLLRRPGSSSSSGDAWLPPNTPASAAQHAPFSQGLLARVFADADRQLLASGINATDSGSTALLAHIGPDRITTAWVGDSRAVLGRRVQQHQRQQHGAMGSISGAGWRQQLQQLGIATGSSSSSSSSTGGGQPLQLNPGWQAVALTDDHKPDREDEQRRIMLSGGRVQQCFGRGPYRVWFQGVDYPGLAMSRAFGDTPCRRIGVTVEPELHVQPLTPDDRVLVAASDGIWDVMSNEEAVRLAGDATSAAAAAKALVEEAEGRWLGQDGGLYVDDITAIVVKATPRVVVPAAAVHR